MALRTFETADAQYYLGLGRHDTSSAPIFEDVDLGSLDFLVLEGGHLSSPINIRNFRQYHELIKRYKDRNTPATLYDVDCAPTQFAAKCELNVTIVSTLIGILSYGFGFAEIAQQNISFQNTNTKTVLK